MVLSDEKKRQFMKKLLMSRMRILVNNGFYGLLLMHMVYSIDESVENASTDGKRIMFNPSFLESLSDSELDFVLMHEILHVVLKHCFRRGDRDEETYGLACDIIVNSNILKSNDMDINSIMLREGGVMPHTAPDGKEGYGYTVEELYDLLFVTVDKPSQKKEKGGIPGNGGMDGGNGGGGENEGKGKGKGQEENGGKGGFDDHTKWNQGEDNEEAEEEWTKRLTDACESMLIRDPTNSRGTVPTFAERLFKELKKPQTDWRTILNEFIQEEVVDYSFTPPDRRFDDNPFFLPDFNEKDDKVEDILFMIDTSGSMSDDMITAAYSEVKGAIDQFDGKLKGWLGFFDAAVIEPKPFEDEDEFKIIKPEGGGGTSFHVIFKYVSDNMMDKPPVSIIILTDGYAPFPNESMALGIPVLWLLNNEKVEPPWGKIARIKVEK